MDDFVTAGESHCIQLHCFEEPVAGFREFGNNLATVRHPLTCVRALYRYLAGQSFTIRLIIHCCLIFTDFIDSQTNRKLPNLGVGLLPGQSLEDAANVNNKFLIRCETFVSDTNPCAFEQGCELRYDGAIGRWDNLVSKLSGS